MLLRIAAVDDLAAGMHRRVAIPQTTRSVMVVVERDGIFAVENACPHHGAAFDGGGVTPNHLVCPWHFWRVDFRTGACLHNPFVTVATYPVVERAGAWFVDLPDPIATDDSLTGADDAQPTIGRNASSGRLAE